MVIAADIDKLLREISTGTQNADRATRKNAKTVEKVNEGAKAASNRFKLINENIDNVVSMIENFSGTAEEQNAVTEKIASSMEQSSYAVNKISDQINKITEISEIQKNSAKAVLDAANCL